MTRAYLSVDDALLFLSNVPDGPIQLVLLPTVEFDSAAMALKIFHSKVLESKSLVIPVQCKKSLSLDSTTILQPAHPTSIVPPLASAPTAPGGMSRPTGPALVSQYTIANQESGKDAHVYPLHVELYHWTPQQRLHCYKVEAEFSYTILFLIKLNWLDNESLGELSTIHPDFEAMVISIPRLLQADFMSLKDPVLYYASHTSIAPTRMWLLTACAVHYDLDFGLVTRYLGGKYTVEWCDVKEILSLSEPFVTPEVVSQMERILTTGCPLYFNWEEDAANKHAFVSHCNLPSVAQHDKLVAKTLTKEVCNSHLIPIARWVCTCLPWGRHVPQNILIKLRKKPRLIWDGSTCMFWYKTSMNMVTPMELKMEITFGTAFTNLCIWIWNLQISYPEEDILGILGNFILLLVPRDLS